MIKYFFIEVFYGSFISWLGIIYTCTLHFVVYEVRNIKRMVEFSYLFPFLKIKVSSWLSNKIQHTGFKGLNHFITALRSCMPFLCLGRARVPSDCKFPQQISESTEVTMNYQICVQLFLLCSISFYVMLYLIYPALLWKSLYYMYQTYCIWEWFMLLN